MKNERVRTCKGFLAMVRHHFMAMLNWIVMLDESAVFFHIPQTKQQSIQWLGKGQPGPFQVKVQASRSTKMALGLSLL
jgi:hypothetical protein